jgi:uncharacterized protein (TIGR03067 family)
MVIRLMCVLSLFCAGAAMAAADDKGDAKKEFEKLKGTWKFTSMEMDGNPVPKSEDMPTITFDGDKFAVKAGGVVLQAGTQTIDPSKKPYTVDAKVTEGEGKGNTMLGIYKVDGDTLTACFDPTGKKRPTEFKTTAGSGHMLVTAKREKK